MTGKYFVKIGGVRGVRGTALLVALLVMAVLITISLALSTLIFRESRLTVSLIDSGKAYYAAESAIEVGLYGLNTRLPGWEPTVDSGDDYKTLKVSDDLDSLAELKMKNKCKAYPCFDEEKFDIGTAQSKVFYDVLERNGSINIPLFVVENGVENKVTDFTVEFFAPFDPKTDLNLDDTKDLLSGWDVLRWKIFGINEQYNVTESISDFTAMSMTNNPLGGGDFGVIPSVPSWFGSVRCGDGLSQAQNQSRYTSNINCVAYVFDTAVSLNASGLDQVSKIVAGNCDNTAAREYYEYAYESADERKLVLSANGNCYPIKNFLGLHKLNYLTLTNLINPAVFVDGLDKESNSKLYYRVELFTDSGAGQTVREVADLTANGYSGDNKQSVNVQIKRGSFMPVFNFSLYSTYKSGEAGDDDEIHDWDYWYGDKEEEPDLPG